MPRPESRVIRLGRYRSGPLLLLGLSTPDNLWGQFQVATSPVCPGRWALCGYSQTIDTTCLKCRANCALFAHLRVPVHGLLIHPGLVC
jgi:hypothetical protein